MTRSWMALGLAALVAAPVWAQSDAASTNWWRPYVGVGYTWGGQTIFPAKIQVIGTSTTYDEDISAGAGLDLRTGLHLRPGGGPFGIKGAVAYHVDGASGLNGWGSFHRMPVELGLSWAFSDQLSIGLGARRSLRAQFRSHWDEYEISTNPSVKVPADARMQLKAKPAFYAEVEWMATPNLGLQARYVRESFRAERESFDISGTSYPTDYQGNGPTYRADHFGLMLAYYFR